MATVTTITATTTTALVDSKWVCMGVAKALHTLPLTSEAAVVWILM